MKRFTDGAEARPSLTNVHTCAYRGLLVGPKHVVPPDAEDYGHGALPAPVGCNHLVCERCGADVRSAVGHPHAQRFDIEEAYAAPDLARLPYMHAGPAEIQFFRFYLCRCSTTMEGGWRRLEREPDVDLPELHWWCGGHPPQAVPGTCAGVEIHVNTPFMELARKNLTGWTPPGARADERNVPGAWLRRLHARLLDTTLAERVPSAVVAALDTADANVLSGAIAFFDGFADSPDSDAIEALWDREKDGVLAQPDPRALNDETLASSAAVVIGTRALLGKPDGGRLREAAVRGSGRYMLRFLVHADPEWAVEHVVDIARHGGFREPIDVMYPLPEADRVRALRALVAADAVPREEALDYARTCLAEHEDLLTELERT